MIDHHQGSEAAQLTFEGTNRIETSRSNLWEHISNPETLATCLPGAERVDQLSEETYSAEITRGINRLILTLSGEVQLVERSEPDWVIAEGSAYDSTTHSEFDGTVAIELVEVERDLVDLYYKAYLSYTGGSAVLPTRILRAVIERDVDRYFENLATIVEDGADP